jgi:MFS family permease
MTGTRNHTSHGAPGGRAESWVGFAGAAFSLVAVFAASASPIPLYELYRRTDGWSRADLSLTAVAYFVAVMAALVVLGRLSNHLGRRPVTLAALAIEPRAERWGTLPVSLSTGTATRALIGGSLTAWPGRTCG